MISVFTLIELHTEIIKLNRLNKMFDEFSNKVFNNQNAQPK